MMETPLMNVAMNDGSRQFAELSETAGFNDVRRHSSLLQGSVETNFITDNVTEMWLEFDYLSHKFSVNNQFGDYLFFVQDPNCPDSVLIAVRNHFSTLQNR